MEKHTAKGLSEITGVSVRTLHYYDDIGLLKPAIRTEGRYRLYGVNELYRLRKILFLKDLDFPLKHIRDFLDDPNFDRVKALDLRRVALDNLQRSIDEKLNIIDTEISKIKNKKMITDDELFDGFPNGKSQEIREQAIEKYGWDKIETSEHYLKQLSKEELEALKNEQREIFNTLYEISDQDVKTEKVQLEVARHYKNVRRFWGTDGSRDAQWKQYICLGQLYLEDQRFCSINGEAKPGFASFLSEAMSYFATRQLT